MPPSSRTMPCFYRHAILFLLIFSIGPGIPSTHPQFPLSLPSAATSTPVRSQPLRVAIIGGGPAGTSASYFLSQFANLSGNPLELHIFERSNYIGGRSQLIYPFDSHIYPPFEAGASIFVPANKHLHQAVRQFHLTLESQSKNPDYAIWDGTEFAFESSGRAWWDTIKLFWRYGRAPFQLNSLSKRIVDQFVNLVYSDQFVQRGPFEELHDWIRAVGFSHLISTSANHILTQEESINLQAVNELAAIMVRTNYGQDICNIHGLGALISIAGSGGTSVRGGNRQIFENFANASTAHLHLEHQVTTITQSAPSNDQYPSTYELTYRNMEQNSPHKITDSRPFDAVILAAPYHQADMTILSSSPIQIPSQPFVKLHVTFVVTNSTAPSGELFNRPPDHLMARSIYSTMMRNVVGKGQRPIFNSLVYLKDLGPRNGILGDVHIVKIFSEAAMSTDTLSKLFGSHENLIWIKRLEWDAYPMLTPLARSTSYAPTKLGEHFYYVNGFESIVSTMETQTLAAWNIAMILSQDFWNFIPNRSWSTG